MLLDLEQGRPRPIALAGHTPEACQESPCVTLALGLLPLIPPKLALHPPPSFCHGTR